MIKVAKGLSISGQHEKKENDWGTITIFEKKKIIYLLLYFLLRYDSQFNIHILLIFQ